MDVFTTFGFPRVIQSDNGTEYVNIVIHALTQLSQVEHRNLSAYQPRANPVERQNHTILSVIRKYLNGNDVDWCLWIPWTQFWVNAHVSQATGSPPFSLMFGRSSIPLPDNINPQMG